MSSVKVSALTAKTSPSGSEELLINDGGTSKKITIANLTKGHDLPAVPSGITTDTNKEYNLKLTDVSGTETLTWIEETDNDTTYSNFVGDDGVGGVTTAAGLVPAPTEGDAAAGKYLDSDGNWTVPPDTDTDTTYSNFAGTTAGLVPTSTTGDDTKFLRADGTWVVPTDTDTNTTYTSSDFTHDDLTGFVANEHIDWTTDQGATNIHAGNYTDTNTTYSEGDGGLTQKNFTTTLKDKLDGIEASADVTDTTNVTAAGALMDSEVTNLAAVKAFATSDYATAAQGTTADAALPKAGGTMTGDVSLGDNVKANFGASDDLQIYHDGTDSLIKDTAQGNLVLTSNGTGVMLRNHDESETMANFNINGSVQLRHDNSTKFETTSSGVDVTGRAVVDSSNCVTVVDNDGSFDMNGGNNFKCTPTGAITLTFTNITNGQSGFILLVNSGQTVSAHANTKVDANLLATVTAAGTYLVSYFSDGTNVYLTNSAVYA